MLVSNGTAINILLANNNKLLNDVLKETDNKTLNNIIKQNKGISSESIDTGKILKEIFESIKDGTKSNSTLENILKNSNLFKDLGNVSTNVSNLMNNIKDDKSLQKFKPLLENFLKNFKDTSFDSLKEQIKNSGLFLESKLAQNSNISTKLENTLQNISNLIKNIDTPQTKEINNLINNIVKNISNPTFSNTDLQANLKTLTSSLQNLNNTLNTPITQNLNTLTNELKSIINQGILVESKLENNPIQNQNNNTNITKLENTLQNISNLIKNLDTPQTKEINNLINNIVKDISNPTFSNTDLQSNLKTLISSLQNLNNTSNTPITQNLNILDTKESINVQVKELLVQIKSDIVQNPNMIQNKNILPIIDNLLKTNDFFFKPQIAQNNTQISQNISNMTNNLNTNLLAFSSNFEANLNPLLSALKDSLHSVNPQNSQIQEHINTLIKKVETIIQEQISNPKQSLKLEDDFKAVLLKMQDELGSKTDIKSQENLRTINNLITQIDYHQLTSFVSNSNYVYIPFFWEMLEDGSIEMKQKDEDKFFCQINLTLKDFGKVDLMLSLYNENKIDMTIYAQREHFKVAIRDNMQKLKIALNDANLIPVNIKLLDMTNEDLKDEKPSNIYQQNYYDEIFGLQVDIKA